MYIMIEAAHIILVAINNSKESVFIYWLITPPPPPGPATHFTSKAFLFLLRAGALVQWLNLAAWKVGVRGFEPHSGLQVFQRNKCLPHLKLHLATATHNFKWVKICLIWDQTFAYIDVN